jgi:hypothetical protein
VLPGCRRPGAFSVPAPAGLVGETFRIWRSAETRRHRPRSADDRGGAGARHLTISLSPITALCEGRTHYDLILAADTMIYIDDLGPTFSGVATSPRQAGSISSPRSGTGGWEQTGRRFRHGELMRRGAALPRSRLWTSPWVRPRSDQANRLRFRGGAQSPDITPHPGHHLLDFSGSLGGI